MEFRRAANHEAVGSSNQGRIHYTFDQLVDLFGAPHHLFDIPEDDIPNKVRCEWDLYIDGEFISIYDWCQYDTDVKDVDIWHVGGFSVKSIQKLMEFISRYYDHYKKVEIFSK